MSWLPSDEQSISAHKTTSFFDVIEDAFDAAVPLGPLDNANWSDLQRSYTLDRGNGSPDIAAIRSKLPPELADIPLGAVEADVISLVLNYEHDRVLLVQGPRGAGKSSLIGYIDAALRRSALPHPPVFIRLDGLQLIGEFDRDCPRLLSAAVKKAATNAEGTLKRALMRCARKLGRGTSAADVRDAFHELSNDLVERERRRVVIVFDNLDQLPIAVIGEILNLARAVYVASQVGIIVCLRPNCFLGASQRGDARAFFQYSVNVPAPSPLAWMGQLAERMEVAARKLQQSNRAPFEIAGRRIGPPSIRHAVLRFRDLLKKSSARSAQSDAAALIQAMSADDTRQLRILIRRILGHSRLPVDYLLGLIEDTEYFPLEGLLEGPRTCFKGDIFVPNLLYFRHGTNEPDFMLTHRILNFLSHTDVMETRELLSNLELLDYPESAVLSCIQKLHGPKLIRGTDTDSFEPSAPPRAIQLTSAGKYCRTHLFRTADYIGAVVLDVPLEHRELRRELDRDQAKVQEAAYGRGLPFSLKIESMLEYTEEVCSREWKQISSLTSIRLSGRLRKVVDKLQYGGLMTADLVYALNSVLERSHDTSSLRLRRNLDTYAQRIHALQARLSDVLDKRLSELANRGRKVSRARHAYLPHVNRDDVEVTAVEIGDNLVSEATVRGEVATKLAVISITGSLSGSEFTRTALCVPEYPGRTERLEQRNAVAKFGAVPNHGGAELTSVEVTASSIERSERTLFLLSPEYTGDKIELKLFQYTPGAKQSDALSLGKVIEREIFGEKVRQLLDQVNNECGQGALSRRTIETVGTKLGRLVMDDRGSNTLATLLKLSADCIIFSGDEDEPVPWEWLRPIPHTGEQLSILGEGWKSMRWTKSLGQLAVQRGSHPERTAGSLCTIGLGTDKKKPWRKPVPVNNAQLPSLCSNFDILHLVGHFDKDMEKIIIEDSSSQQKLFLDADEVIAHPFCIGNHTVIISACGVGRLHRQRNIALAIAETHRAMTWAPLASITGSQAALLDDQLATSFNAIPANGPSVNARDLIRKALVDDKLGGLGLVYMTFGL